MTIHAQQSIDVTKVKLRWEEPYVSEALNKSLSTGMTGIHHGFRLIPAGGSSVRLAASSEKGDSLALIADDAQDLAFAYREIDEPSWDMTNVDGAGTDLTGTRAHFLLYVNYAIGQPTEAEIRIVDDAEMGAAWIAQTIKLGSVRVPASGAVSSGHIEHATAHFAGLSKGKSSLWDMVNDNPNFDFNLAGYQTEDSELASVVSARTSPDDVITGRSSAVLGRTSSGATNTEVGLTVRLEQFEPGDLLFFRAKLKGSAFAGDTELGFNISSYNWSTADQTVWLDYVFPTPSASFEDYGFIIEVPDYTKGEIVVGGLGLSFVNAGDTGEVVIDSFEVLHRSAGEYTRTIPKEVRSAAEVHFGDPNNESNAWAKLAYYGGALTLSGPDLDDNIRLYDAVQNSIPQESLADAAYQSNQTYLGLDSVVRMAVLSGGEVTQNTTTSVDITDTEVRGASGLATYKNRRFDAIPGVTDFPVGKSEDQIVYALAGSQSFGVADASTFWNETEPYVPLAYVVISGGVIDRIIDIRDFVQRVERQLPLSVGPEDTSDSDTLNEQRFYSLRGALKYAELFYPEGAEINVYGSVAIDGGFDLHSNLTIKGRGPKAEIVVRNIPTSGAAITIPDGVSDVKLEDLHIVSGPGSSGTGTSHIYTLPDTTVSNITLRNVRTKTEGGDKPDYSIRAEGTIRDLRVEGCVLDASDETVMLGELAGNWVIRDSNIRGVIDVQGDPSYGRGLLEKCKISLSSGALTTSYLRDHVTMRDCDVSTTVNADNECLLDNCRITTSEGILSTVKLSNGGKLINSYISNEDTSGSADAVVITGGGVVHGCEIHTENDGIDVGTGETEITNCLIVGTGGTGRGVRMTESEVVRILSTSLKNFTTDEALWCELTGIGCDVVFIDHITIWQSGGTDGHDITGAARE